MPRNKKYELLITQRFKKDFKKLESDVQNRIIIGLEGLKDDPQKGKPLARELKDLWSYRIGKCRVIYRIAKKERLIIAEHVGYRREIYKKKK